MIKVIIADDEARVCQLIYNLIDWQSVNMEVVGIAHNGIDALELIKIHKPNLVITDIRMPGYDGLELISRGKKIDSAIDWIIISGYNHFEYAQNGIKYGVCDYLLKPIKKDELLSTLIKISDKFKLKTEMLSRQAQSHRLVQNDIDKLRSGLFVEILLQKKHVSHSFTLNEINQNYHFNFQEGSFQVVVIKMDYGLEESYNLNIQMLQNKMVQVLNTNLKGACFDTESYCENSMIYSLLNYEKENKKDIRKRLKNVLNELGIQKSIFQQVEFTIGLGGIMETFSQVEESLETARTAIDQRLIEGTGHLIEKTNVVDTYHFTNRLLAELNKSMSTSLEILDKEGVLKSINTILNSIKEVPDLSGTEAFKIAEEVCNIYIILLRNNQLILCNLDEFYKSFCMYANRCGSLEKIFSYLSKCIEESLDQIIEDKKQAHTRPIRMAKQYIQQNFTHPISLEEVSDYVGFNASYFSTLFKKETNTNFLEYLLETRMNHAKELLKETNLNVSEICEHVGYNDLKYFVKIFKKNTGISPNEYRKLYA